MSPSAQSKARADRVHFLALFEVPPCGRGHFDGTPIANRCVDLVLAGDFMHVDPLRAAKNWAGAIAIVDQAAAIIAPGVAGLPKLRQQRAKTCTDTQVAYPNQYDYLVVQFAGDGQPEEVGSPDTSYRINVPIPPNNMALVHRAGG